MANVVPLRSHVYGATPVDWAHMRLVVGDADLLPVVSNPNAVISPQSTMKSLGKTPSLYNGNRQAAGIQKWTQKQTTAEDIARWSKERDYGLCIQCRRVRGLDLDCPDPDLSGQIAAAFLASLGVPSELPIRGRAGSGKQLLAFELVGQFAKRSFKLRDGAGIVEFLADGQQFIAIGTHPSGTRYEWEGGLPVAFPEVGAAAFERAWAAIVEEFGLGDAVEGDAGADRSRADLTGVEDPVAEYLEDKGLILGAQGEKLFVDCPWQDGHSSDSGISETAWLVAGTKGFERGHFQCLHASCQARKDEDFLDAVGYRVAAFKNLDEEPEGGDAAGGGAERAAEDMPWPKFKRNPTTGKIEATLDNVTRALACPPMMEATVRYDTFNDELQVDGRAFTDADSVRLRIILEQRGFKPVAKELMRDALLVHASDNEFDSAQDWLTALPAWDGVCRAERLYPAFFNTDDTPYTQAVGLYTMTALAARVMDPGCKVDMVPILAGDQGFLKSSAVMALSPPGTFRVLNLHDLESANLSRRLRGCLVGEMAELRGLRTRDAESIKAWIVQQEERWVPKFVERETSFKRRLLLFGTTNPVGVLDDETGERRWLPMVVRSKIALEPLEAVRDQLWAEGLWRWRMDGVAWREAERLAEPEHAKFKVQDPLASRVSRWVEGAADVSGETYHDRGWLLMADLLDGVSGAGAERLTDRRAGKILRSMGWKSQSHRVDGKVYWAWVRDT